MIIEVDDSQCYVFSWLTWFLMFLSMIASNIFFQMYGC